ncbi:MULTISPECIES: hypothetical protein [Bacillus cereus group]|nr:hypothetical protein [Bacillus cereus]EJR27960.1 hypothetical protein IIE_05373 [Bacillus cereus VD045]HDR4349417.1 hypothetical protein [Bacillus cereus]HDR6958045.1 hypothetical protein [Bacillus cereus]
MAETFFGPWNITLDLIDSHFHPSIFISRSENSDGRYHVKFGDTLDLAVQGEEWTIQIDWFSSSQQQYLTCNVHRVTNFIVGKGLIVELGAIMEDYFILSMVCTSTDPETNPIPSNNPYNFTLPGR